MNKTNMTEMNEKIKIEVNQGEKKPRIGVNENIIELLNQLPWRIKGKKDVPEKHWLTKAELVISKLPYHWQVEYVEQELVGVEQAEGIRFQCVTLNEALKNMYSYLINNNFINEQN